MPAGDVGKSHLKKIPEACQGGGDAEHGPVHCRRNEHRRQERRAATRKDLDCKKELKRIAPKAGPADLTLPDFRERAPAERLTEGPSYQPNPQSLPAHELGRGCVFCKLARQRVDTASAFQYVPAPEHGLALGEAQADAIREALPPGLIGIEEGAFELCPNAGGAHPMGGEHTKPVLESQAASRRRI